MVHVVPANDLKEHDLSGHLCHCQPQIEFVEGEMLVKHWAYDNREEVEARTQDVVAPDKGWYVIIK